MKHLLVSGLLLLAIAGIASAQKLSPELVEPAKALHDAFDFNLKEKGWERRSIEPLLNSPDVIVDSWRFPDRQVRVSIVLHPEDPEARRRFRGPHLGTRLDGIGDEAHIEGYCNSLVTFYRGRLSISVSTAMDLRLLAPSEQEAKDLSCAEAAATSKLMACFVNAALSGKFSKDNSAKTDPLKTSCEIELVRRGLVGDYVVQRLYRHFGS